MHYKLDCVILKANCILTVRQQGEIRMKQRTLWIIIIVMILCLCSCGTPKEFAYFTMQEKAISYMKKNGYTDTMNSFEELDESDINNLLKYMTENNFEKKTGYYIDSHLKGWTSELGYPLFNYYNLMYLKFKGDEIVESWQTKYWCRDKKITYDYDYDDDFNIKMTTWAYFEKTKDGMAKVVAELADLLLCQGKPAESCDQYIEIEDATEILENLEEIVEDYLEWPFLPGCYIKYPKESEDGYLWYLFDFQEKKGEKSLILYAAREP